jgi:hypothetical protein
VFNVAHLAFAVSFRKTLASILTTNANACWEDWSNQPIERINPTTPLAAFANGRTAAIANKQKTTASLAK